VIAHFTTGRSVEHAILIVERPAGRLDGALLDAYAVAARDARRSSVSG
jgi:hypothetical protein